MLNNCTASLAMAFAATVLAPPLAECASQVPTYCQREWLDTENGSDAYAFRGDRCEGVYRVKISGGSRRFVLSSLTSSRGEATLKDQSKLEVHWVPLPAGVRLRISVVPISSPVLYRMDTEVDGAAGEFRWPTDIVHGRISSYLNLGVVALYTEGNQTIYVACALGPVPQKSAIGLRADVLSLEPLRRIDVFSRRCSTSGDCPAASESLSATLPARDRSGTFTVPIAPLAQAAFYAFRFVGQIGDGKVPPVATSIVLRTPSLVTPPGPVK